MYGTGVILLRVSIYKRGTSLRRTVEAGPDGVSLREV